MESFWDFINGTSDLIKTLTYVLMETFVLVLLELIIMLYIFKSKITIGFKYWNADSTFLEFWALFLYLSLFLSFYNKDN